MPEANCLIVCPPLKLSSTQECDKDRQLKHVKLVLRKKFPKIKLKHFKSIFCFNVLTT